MERAGVEVACGGEYVPGERLIARIDDVAGLRYVMELTAGGAFDQSNGGCFGANLCGGLRCAKGDGAGGPDGTGQVLIAPTDGSDLVVHGAWARGFGALNIPDDCVLTAAAIATTPPPTTATPATIAPVAAALTMAPTPALLNASDVVPPYAIVTNGTCVSHGMIDILDVDQCRLVMNDGYYNTRDQDGNGVLDA